VSHLIRNILEDAFQLVDDVVDGVDEIVNDSVELARRVGRDARRVAGAVREAVVDADLAPPSESAEPAEPTPVDASAGALAHVFAWNAVIANQAARCARCDAAIERGAEAFLGLSDDPARPRTWLCPPCREGL